MSDALRAVFAEFGFDIDGDALEAADKRVREVIKTVEELPKAAAATAKATTAAAAATKVAPDLKPIESYLDLLKRVDEKSSEAIGKILGPHIEKLAGRFKPLNSAVKAFGIDLKDGTSIARVFTTGTLAAGHAVLKLALALVGFANNFSDHAEALRETAANAGVTTSELQSLHHAGTQSGVGADRLAGALQSLHQQMQESRLHGGGVNHTLRRLGVESRTAGRGIRNASDVMNDLSVSFDRIQSPLRRDRIGVRLFGQEWYRLREVMHGGRGGLMDLRAQMEALGGGVLPEAVEASRRYTQATGRLGVAQDSLRSVFAVGILPALTFVAEKAALVTGWWSRMARGTNVVQIGLAALAVVAVAAAGAALVAWWPVILPFAKAAVVIALVWLALDDLVALFRGGKSVIGEAIDTLFGVGAATQMVKDLKAAWEGVVDVVSQAIEKVADFVGLDPTHDDGRGEVRSVIRRRGAPGAPATSAPTGRGEVRSAIRPGVLNRGAGAFDAALAPVPGTITAGAPHLAPVPLTRSVAAPGGRGGRTVVRQTTVANHNHFQLAGPDAHQLAGEVGQILERQAREQRDGDHPVDEDDEA